MPVSAGFAPTRMGAEDRRRLAGFLEEILG